MTNFQKFFKKIGADVSVSKSKTGFTIDVEKGKFLINASDDVDVAVIDVDASDRHLLINVTETSKVGIRGNKIAIDKYKFLCGHDERDWFIASISARVKNVEEAKQSLKPNEVLEVERNVPKKKKQKRKNGARVRQGEWFFIPAPDLIVDAKLIHKNEPISRGNGSKPHMVDEVYRRGGETVYVSNRHPSGISEAAYKQLKTNEERMGFRPMVANAEVYARGDVRHKDHATIHLHVWHRVLMNREGSRNGRLVFLD